MLLARPPPAQVPAKKREQRGRPHVDGVIHTGNACALISVPAQRERERERGDFKLAGGQGVPPFSLNSYPQLHRRPASAPRGLSSLSHKGNL